ncbi:unnamed protein product [Prunus armeniaca]|uniref:DUF1639 domain-containing protein n=1 Tax=Prunus armeniaca TaxID=36596 RepID=A0A6J5XBI6_PRUAR|nr:unnamed protein product [Prunus armeniaca]
MATAPVKPPLHNFPLAFLKWGAKNNSTTNNNHRYRRPVSAEPASEPDSESERTHYNNSRVGSSRASRHRYSLIPCAGDKRRRSEERESDQEEGEEADKAEVVQKPWNLRPRRAPATTSFSKGGANGEPHELESPNPNQSELQQPKSMRLRGLAAEGQNVEKKEKRKFWIALSKEEIEEDIFVMTGSRPARRPKKRPKNVQKQLDVRPPCSFPFFVSSFAASATTFPGLWLVGVTADAYKVADSPSKISLANCNWVFVAEVDLYCAQKIVTLLKVRKWKRQLPLRLGTLNSEDAGSI